MGAIAEASIRERAYQIWEREGRPHGREFEHWVRAQVELEAEARTRSLGGKPKRAPVAAAAQPRAAAHRRTVSTRRVKKRS